MKSINTFPVSCNRDCGGGCALLAHTENNKIIRITDNPDRLKYMKGCIKGYRAAETLYHKERILKPLIRNGKRGSGNFREASWNEALNLITEKLKKLKKEDRCSSLLRIGGSGSCRGALHNTDFTAMRFLSLFGNFTDTLGNFSSEASAFVKQPVFGTRYVGVDAETLLHSKNIILWGFNPFDTRFDCEIESVLKEASEKGIPITVIDPRKTRTVEALNAQWIPVKPGGDSALMLAVLFVLLEKNKLDREFMNTYSHGFDKMEKYILGECDSIKKSPLWAEKICGISSERIEQFALEYAAAPVSALLPGLSLQRAIGGENTDRLGAVLQLATGNTGKQGGSTGSSKWNRLKKPVLGNLPVPENSSVKGVPVYLWADAVLEGTDGGYPSDIGFIYNCGGNYIGQGSDTAKAVRAFEKADFSVTHDYFLTATACYSDVVLPVTTFLEREDFINTQNNLVFYSAKAVEPAGEAKNDYNIFSELAGRLGFGEKYTENKTEQEWLDSFLKDSDIADLNDFRKKGFYAGTNRLRVGLSDFISDPRKYPLQTKSGKIEIACDDLLKSGGTLLPEHILIGNSQKYPLRMISPHEKYRVHSQNDNVPSLKKLCDDRLWINKSDADRRSIKEGDPVEVRSREGSVHVKAFVTDKITEGTVSLNQGVWAAGISPSAGANVNFLTSTEPAKPSMGSRTHSIVVNVLKI